MMTVGNCNFESEVARECQRRSKRKAAGEGNGKGGTMIYITSIAIYFAIKVVRPKEVMTLNVV